MDYTPLQLYRKEKDSFFCPECGEVLGFQKFAASQKENDVSGFCKHCRKPFRISPPYIKKKLIYLDSWFLSGLFNPSKHPNQKQKDLYERLLKKLNQLVHHQKAQIVVSDIHAQEISRIPDKYDSDKFWRDVVCLAMGVVSKDHTDIQVSQMRRLIANEEEVFSWKDLFDHNPHSWNPGIKIITQLWHLGINRQFGPRYQNTNNGIRWILENQINDNSAPKETIEQCFSYICRLWVNNTLKGIDFKKKDLEFHLTNRSGIGKVPSFEELEQLATHNGKDWGDKFIYWMIELESSCEKKYNFLESLENYLIDKKELSRSVLILNAFEGIRLHRASNAMKQGGLTKHEKKFSERYGLSAINDAFHISTYAPYVDSMTVDRNAYNIIQTELVQKYLSDLKCVFYSSKNIEDFETWLDTLLNEKEPEDVRLAKRLLIGYTVEELIEDVFRRVKRNLNSRG